MCLSLDKTVKDQVESSQVGLYPKSNRVGLDQMLSQVDLRRKFSQIRLIEPSQLGSKGKQSWLELKN